MDQMRDKALGHNWPRNPGVALKPDWFEEVGVNTSAVERRAATLTTRRTVKKEWQAAWLVKAITCIDLTTLAGDDTPGRVRRLCAKARRPLRDDLVEALGLWTHLPTVGAVCVYPTMVAPAVRALEGSGIPVASVATGFPAGPDAADAPARGDPLRGRRGRGRDRHRHHPRPRARRQNWRRSTTRSAPCARPAARRISRPSSATGDLKTLRNVDRGRAGRDDGRRRLHQDLDRQGGRQRDPAGEPRHGRAPSATIGSGPASRSASSRPAACSTAKDALAWLILMKEELGARGCEPDLFRIGASGSLTDIERQLEHFVTGRYSAAHRHAMA